MKIVVLSSHTTSLFWFRLDMMKEFVDLGHEVIATGSEPEEIWQEKFNSTNIIYRCIPVHRNGINPCNDLITFWHLYKFLKQEKPDKVFTYQAKTIVYGSIAARLNKISDIYILIAGLGSVFRGFGLKNSLLKAIMRLQYRIACNLSRRVFFQNNDDKYEFIKQGIVNEAKTAIINGSGVNLSKFKPAPLPLHPAFLFIGRLLKDKGIIEYLEAASMIKKIYPDARFMLVGPYDSNPSGIKPDELEPYIQNGIVEFYGEVSDVRPFIAQCSVYVLPSYHEGTPKTVLEAMAMARPIITTDAPGCRETVTDRCNGFLVPVKDPAAIVEKMGWYIENQTEMKKMGLESLEICIKNFDVKKVNSDIIKSMKL